MTVDISGLLTFAGQLIWDYRMATSVALSIAQMSGFEIEHDADAGEDWVRILGSEKTLGLIAANRRLIILEPHVPIPLRLAEPVVIYSASLSATNLTATTEAIQAAFPYYNPAPDMGEVFSFGDLWFATV